MLKLYKTTIIVSSIIAVLALFIGLICEWFHFAHYAFIQNLAIGLFCSLLVVVITSVLQYKHTQKNVFGEYARALWNLVSQVGEAYRIGNRDFTDDFYKYIFQKIDDAFVRFDLYGDELVWFSPKKQQYAKMICFYENRMQINCIRKTLKSDKDAVLYLAGNQDYIAMINSAIQLLGNSTISELMRNERDYSLQQLKVC